MNRPIIINLKQLTDHIIIVGNDISKKDLTYTIQKLLINALSEASYAINNDDGAKICVEITLKKPEIKNSVEVVTDPDTGDRFGRIPFEHTHEFQIMELTKILKNLEDGTYTITIVPEKEDNGA